MYEVKQLNHSKRETEALIEKLKEREFGVLYQVNFKEKIKLRFCCKVFQKIYFSVKLRKKTERTE